MNNEVEIIFKEQVQKLPPEVTVFLSSSKWDEILDEICASYNFSDEEHFIFKHEAVLVLIGLTHPDDFLPTIKERMTTTSTATLETAVKSVEQKILAPIRLELSNFFDKEAEAFAQDTSNAVYVTDLNAQLKPRMQMPDIAPENLPTEEGGESFLPPIPLKFGAEGVSAPVHPFEEKMKKVFTAGQQSLGDLAIEPPSQTSSPTQVPKAPPIFHADPYREPIE